MVRWEIFSCTFSTVNPGSPAGRLGREALKEAAARLPGRQPAQYPLHLDGLVQDHREAHVAVGELLDQHAEVERAGSPTAILRRQPDRAPATPGGLLDQV